MLNNSSEERLEFNGNQVYAYLRIFITLLLLAKHALETAITYE